VWFDAVIGYLSASIEWARRTGDPEAWRKWWNDPEALSYYFMGKDNIVFHSQIWPAELLGYNGQGAKGGAPGDLGVLNLPTEVVSSEFLTMEGKKFSSSHGIVIYVRDFLSRYQADALRYFISAAGPETSDSDFTWAEFVRRTNGELVAGWGNLVNRTASMIAKKFCEIPSPGELEDIDRALLDAVEAGFETVGNLIRHHRQKAALSEAMRLVGEANKYVTDTEPFKLKAPEQQQRLATVLWTLAQAVTDLNLMLSPFLPHAANDIDRVMGGAGEIAPMPYIEDVEELDPQVLPADFEGRDGYPIITGDYTNVPTWERHPITVGTPIAKPTPVLSTALPKTYTPPNWPWIWASTSHSPASSPSKARSTRGGTSRWSAKNSSTASKKCAPCAPTTPATASTSTTSKAASSTANAATEPAGAAASSTPRPKAKAVPTPTTSAADAKMATATCRTCQCHWWRTTSSGTSAPSPLAATSPNAPKPK